MIENYSVKLAVDKYFKLKMKRDISEYDVLLSEIILYKFLSSLISQNPGLLNDIDSTVESYGYQYVDKVLEMKYTYVSYSKIVALLEKNSIKSFVSMSEDLIEQIYTIYLDRTVVLDFSIVNYHQNMYKLNNLSLVDDVYLKKVHYNIMIPISEYYHSLSNIPYGNLEIEYAKTALTLPGKEIKFYISGVDSIIVYNDIINKRINIKYSELRLMYPFIMIRT